MGAARAALRVAACAFQSLIKSNLMGDQESVKVLEPLGSENTISRPKHKDRFSITTHKKHLPSHNGLLFTDLKCLVDNEMLNFRKTKIMLFNTCRY